MLITDIIFEDFLNCPTKAWLKAHSVDVVQSSLLDWKLEVSKAYEEDFYNKSQRTLPKESCLKDVALDEATTEKSKTLLNSKIQVGNFQSRFHALEIVPDSKAIFPVRAISKEKLTGEDKLLLGFDALVVSERIGKPPPFGKIVHGRNMKVVKIRLLKIMPVVNRLVADLEKQQKSDNPPPLILNRHCVECEFQKVCRKEATNKDDLSLLSAMTKKERDKYHEKGIFSITQLSHIFRPRRKSKRLTNKKHEMNSYPLRALAIREQKIHIIGNPQLQIAGTPVYLDVEGDPERDFYYLIGMRFTEGEILVTHSFWADEVTDEKELWISFLSIIQKLNNPQLIYYGSYEKVFLEKMRQRYGELDIAPVFLDQVQARAINLVSFLFGQIYFPTYSNSLKEIARYLGFEWTENTASGITSLMWRFYWEKYKHDYKERLLVYNSEDCGAIERLTHFLLRLNIKQTESLPTDNEVVQAESLKLPYSFEPKFGKAEFVLPEFQIINKAAYWDYQQEKIYFRSHSRQKRRQKKKRKDVVKKTHFNKIVHLDFSPPQYCPKCQTSRVVKNGSKCKVIYDIKFGNGSVKRWIVKYYYARLRCQDCGYAAFATLLPWTSSRYGHNLIAYTVYQIIDLQISQSATAENIQQLFGFPMAKSTIGRFKTQAAEFYLETYENLINRLKSGKLIHADETRIRLKGEIGYVWVLSNLEEVVYFCTDSREGSTLKEYLKNFQGILVSDFYSVYDSFNCPQQKCLIHLMRDLNDALHKEPFNSDLKELVQMFASLLKPIIDTVDRFGLKSRYLRRHKTVVGSFFQKISLQSYKSAIAQKMKQRFIKNQDKLFTFLDYDGVAWNNNNAEHAVKAFAALRKPLQGLSTNRGMQEYLILLSVSETCKLRGVNFLNFLKSKKTNLEDFV